MTSYELTYGSTTCNPKVWALKFVAIPISMGFFFNNFNLLRIFFSLQEK